MIDDIVKLLVDYFQNNIENIIEEKELSDILQLKIDNTIVDETFLTLIYYASKIEDIFRLGVMLDVEKDIYNEEIHTIKDWFINLKDTITSDYILYDIFLDNCFKLCYILKVNYNEDYDISDIKNNNIDIYLTTKYFYIYNSFNSIKNNITNEQKQIFQNVIDDTEISQLEDINQYLYNNINILKNEILS